MIEGAKRHIKHVIFEDPLVTKGEQRVGVVGHG